MALSSSSVAPIESQADLRLLRHVKTGRFLIRNGGWTNEEEQAASFPNFLSLVEFCLQNDVGEVEIVVRERSDPRPTATRIRELLKNATCS